MTDWNLKPEEIEQRSLAIIDAEAPAHEWPPDEWSIIRRMIHTTADFDYVSSVRIHLKALTSGLEAFRKGRTIFTDTRMVQSGISSWRVGPFELSVDCLIDRPETIELAAAQRTTRAVAAVDLALPRLEGCIYVIGNAPTALFRLIEYIQSGRAAPSLVVGLPVGFVNAAESKEALLACPRPYITALGRKGGSNVAAAVVNALADLALKERAGGSDPTK